MISPEQFETLKKNASTLLGENRELRKKNASLQVHLVDMEEKLQQEQQELLVAKQSLAQSHQTIRDLKERLI